MNTTNSRWEIGFWWRGKGQKRPVQFNWFEVLGHPRRKETIFLQAILFLRSIIRRVLPIRLDMCPVDGRIIAVTLPWIGLFFRFRTFHPRCIGYTVCDLDEFHKSRWYHHPVNQEEGHGD